MMPAAGLAAALGCATVPAPAPARELASSNRIRDIKEAPPEPVTVDNAAAYLDRAVALASANRGRESFQIGLDLLALRPASREIVSIQQVVYDGFHTLLSDPTITSLFPEVRHAEGGRMVYENVALGFAVHYPLAWEVLDDRPASASLGGSRLVLRADDSTFIYVEARVGTDQPDEPRALAGRTVESRRFSKNAVNLMIALDAPSGGLARIAPDYQRVLDSAELIGLLEGE